MFPLSYLPAHLATTGIMLMLLTKTEVMNDEKKNYNNDLKQVTIFFSTIISEYVKFSSQL